MNLFESIHRPPFHRWLGVELERVEDGAVTVALPFRDEFVGDPTGQVIHGGIIAALADIAGCFAVVAAVGRDVPTLNLRVDYLRPAPAGVALRAVARPIRIGRTMGVADVVVSTQTDVVVAVARGDFPTAVPVRVGR